MKNIYRLERWQYHCCIETKKFTNKKKAQDWLKESGWWIDFDQGWCYIAIYKNDKEIDYTEEKGWKTRWW